MRGSQSQTRLAHGTRTITHSILADRDNSRQSHNSQHNASSQTGLSHRQIEHLLNERYNNYQPEESVYHRRYTIQQFNNRFQKSACAAACYFRHIYSHRQSERQCKKNRKEAHPKCSHDQRNKTELRGRSCCREPFFTGKHFRERDMLIFQQTTRKVLLYKLCRDKSNDTRMVCHYLTDTFSRLVVFRPQLFFRKIRSNIFQPEYLNSDIGTSHFTPIGYLFVKHIFNLHRTQFPDRILPVDSQHIPFFCYLVAKESECLRKQKNDNQHYRNTCDKATASQYSFDNLFPNLFHTVLVFY